jgi:hypothetical protein
MAVFLATLLMATMIPAFALASPSGGASTNVPEHETAENEQEATSENPLANIPAGGGLFRI